ncbi:sucrose phosphorylase [Ekhidna sp.]|jgi:sucrose phosphorylase|uniref:sucrose phosphorylase n=1 Tax=Ekhidna sp. TaxID=2608089 RepID=UPI0032EEAD5E
MNNKVQLITYADRFGDGDIASLHRLVKQELSDVVRGIHLLPFFFPIDGADAGYDPHDNRVVDARIGSWSDVQNVSKNFPIIVDLIINHVSDKSKEFQDVLQKGSKSEYFELFLTKEKVFGGLPNEGDIDKIYRPRPNRPFSLRRLESGEHIEFWTTFSHKQIDIDVNSDQGQEYVNSVLEVFAENGIKTIRLDAVGYAIKKAGTSCFMIPETYRFIEKVVAKAHKHGIEVLVEIHAHYDEQIKIAKYADYVYDFALPPLVLHCIISKNFDRLKHWWSISPRNCITVLDTHDGIGVMDVASNGNKEGLLSDEELDKLVETIHENSKGQSQKATGAAASNLDLYQVNCTYYDALARDDRKYLVARAIQLFSPGIPQIYYMGLLAGTNDMDLLSSTNVGRDINRSYYSSDEVRERLRRPVVKALFRLIKFRNEHSSFQGEFQLEESDSEVLHVSWKHGKFISELKVDLHNGIFSISYEDGNNTEFLNFQEIEAKSDV